MSKIKVSTKNIGGLDKISAELSTGSVNIVRGSSSSGKSSLMRGVHLGIVGRADKLGNEIENLHLDDRTSDQALLMRGASEGSVKVEFDGLSMSAVIPKNGMIKGTNSNEKGVYTTMLSSLPPTKLHQSVMNPDPDDPDNFIWVVDELSDAGKYQKWYEILHSIEQEVFSVRGKFKDWKEARSSSGTKYDEIMAEISEIDNRREERAKKSGAETDKLGTKLRSAQNVHSKNVQEFQNLSSQLDEINAANEQQDRKIKAAIRREKVAQSRLDEAEDLLDEELILPDMDPLDSAVTAADEKVKKMTGSLNDPKIKRAVDTFRKDEGEISAASPDHGKAMNALLEDVGDEGLQAAMIELSEAKAKRESVIKSYNEKRRKMGDAEAQAAAARSEIQSARDHKREAERAMTVDAGGKAKMEQDLQKVKRVYEASEVEVVSLRDEMKKLDDSPEARDDDKARRELESKLKSLETTTMFEMRLTSLSMMPNDTIRITESQGEAMLGSGEGGEPRSDFVNRYLEQGAPEIKSRLIPEIDNGFLIDVAATSKWAQGEADKQRQETRRIFNEVGTKLFERLKLSPISSVSLDTGYNLKISWSDGSVTGLTGAGGERTIIAAALLISMRKAYTPEIPILMFDGILENLDPKPREGFLDFLSEYAKSEDVAVVVSLFDSSESTATVSVR